MTTYHPDHKINKGIIKDSMVTEEAEHPRVISAETDPEIILTESFDTKNWLGRGAGTVKFGQDYAPHAPVLPPTDWHSV